jgi:hypothetical protein
MGLRAWLHCALCMANDLISTLFLKGFTNNWADLSFFARAWSYAAPAALRACQTAAKISRLADVLFSCYFDKK